MKAKQIVIVGDGPAGSAAALSLMQHLRSSTTEMSNVNVVQVCAPASSQHAVGETIPPAATEWLGRLGVSHLLQDESHLECPGSVSQWGSDRPGFNDFFFTPVGRGYHLNRKRFNHQLSEAVVSAGVEQLLDTKLSSVRAQSDGMVLSLQTSDGAQDIHADFVIDATGIQAKVARSLNVVRNQYDSVISACVLIDLPEKMSFPAAHTIVSAVDHGWWYACRLPDNKALVSFCTDKETLKQQQLGIKKTWQTHFNDSGWFHQECLTQFGSQLTRSSDVLLRVAPSAILSCVVGDDWLAVGDAASSYDSMTSAGITKSLQQGWQAGGALSQWCESQDRRGLMDYQDAIFQEFNHYLRMHQQLYHAEQRFQNQAFWARRQRRSL